VTYEIIPKETEAIKHAIKFAEEGSFITCLSDVVINAIEIVQEYLDGKMNMVSFNFLHIKATGNSSFFLLKHNKPTIPLLNRVLTTFEIYF
jgi:hypothetical protein